MQPAKILLTSLLMLTVHLPCFASNIEDNEEAAKKASLQLIPTLSEEVEDKSEVEEMQSRIDRLMIVLQQTSSHSYLARDSLKEETREELIAAFKFDLTE
jgi:hypothetical protein